MRTDTARLKKPEHAMLCLICPPVARIGKGPYARECDDLTLILAVTNG